MIDKSSFHVAQAIPEADEIRTADFSAPVQFGDLPHCTGPEGKVTIQFVEERAAPPRQEIIAGCVLRWVREHDDGRIAWALLGQPAEGTGIGSCLYVVVFVLAGEECGGGISDNEREGDAEGEHILLD